MFGVSNFYACELVNYCGPEVDEYVKDKDGINEVVEILI